MRTSTGVGWIVALTAAALFVAASPAGAQSADTGSAATGSGDAGTAEPHELTTWVAAGENYDTDLRAAVDYWTNDKLALGGIANNGGTPLVEPTAGGDDLSAVVTGNGEIRKTAGKLLVRRQLPRNPDEYFLTSCSADVVESGNQSVVVAAAHCFLIDSGNWDLGTNFESSQAVAGVFIPGFNGAALANHVEGNEGDTSLPGTDVAPYGVWAVTRQWITGGWAADPSQYGEGPVHDMAAFLVDSPTDSRPIQQVTGGQKIAFNQPQGQALSCFGYPADNVKNWYGAPLVNGVATRTGADNANGVPSALQRSYDGRTLFVNSGDSKAVRGKDLDMIPSGFSPGSSGGPCLQEFDPITGTGVQVGVVSHFVNADGGLPVLETVLNGMNSNRPYMGTTHFVDQEQNVFELAEAQTAPN